MSHGSCYIFFLDSFALALSSVGMAAYAESKASFKHRCLEVGLTERQFDALKDQNIESFNNLAFAICGQPGQIDDGRFPTLVDSAYHNATLGVNVETAELRSDHNLSCCN